MELMHITRLVEMLKIPEDVVWVCLQGIDANEAAEAGTNQRQRRSLYGRFLDVQSPACRSVLRPTSSLYYDVIGLESLVFRNPSSNIADGELVDLTASHIFEV